MFLALTVRPLKQADKRLWNAYSTHTAEAAYANSAYHVTMAGTYELCSNIIGVLYLAANKLALWCYERQVRGA